MQNGINESFRINSNFQYCQIWTECFFIKANSLLTGASQACQAMAEEVYAIQSSLFVMKLKNAVAGL